MVIKVFFCYLIFFHSLCGAKTVFYDPMKPLFKKPIIKKAPVVKKAPIIKPVIQLKPLQINMVVYVDPKKNRASKSWAIINGERFVEGDIVEGRTLVKIERSAVRLEHNGKEYIQALVNSSHVKVRELDDESKVIP